MFKARLALIYFSMFSFIGVHMPFWPLWLSSKGITGTEIAFLTAISFAIKIVFTPIVSNIVDATGKKREAIVILSAGLLLSCAMFFRADGFLPILLLTFVAFACWSPIMPLCESVTTLAAKERGMDYGKIRLWGSIGFMVVAIVGGRVLASHGEGVVLLAIVTAAALLFIASCLLPKDYSVTTARKQGEKPMRGSWKIFFKTRWFVYLILATTLIQGSHAAYYTFGTIQWREQGLGDETIGLLWGVSVASEVAFFAFGRSLLNKIGAINMVIIGGIAATFRWSIIGATADMSLLVIAQLFHAFSFGASHLAAMRIITEKLDPSLSATGQGIYSAFIMGIGMGTFVLISGPLYEALKTMTMLVMAAVALVGTSIVLYMKMTDVSHMSAEPAQSDRSVATEAAT